MRLTQRIMTKPGYRVLVVIAGLLICGHIESKEVIKEPPPVVVVKSVVQERIETILPPEVAAPISRTAYPKTLAAIAHTESRGDHRAVGDHGKAKGLFQVWPSIHGPVGDSIELQVEQANRLFLAMVAQYGYREAVKRWNGSGPAARKYQQVVLAKVRELEQ